MNEWLSEGLLGKKLITTLRFYLYSFLFVAFGAIIISPYGWDIVFAWTPAIVALCVIVFTVFGYFITTSDHVRQSHKLLRQEAVESKQADSDYAPKTSMKGVLGRHERLEILTDAVAGGLNSTHDLELDEKGAAYMAAGFYKKALLCFTLAADANPNEPNLWNDRGIVLDILGRYEEALQAFDTAIELNPYYDNAYMNKAMLLNRSGRIDEALVFLDHALSINRHNEKAWFNKGQLLAIDAGNIVDALGCYEKAALLGYPEAQEAVAICWHLIQQKYGQVGLPVIGGVFGPTIRTP